MCCKRTLSSALLLPVENPVGITPNPTASCTLHAWASLPALGWGEPARLNWMQTPGCAQPPSRRLELFWLPGLSAARNAAGGRCLHVTPGLCRAAAARWGDTERGWGRWGRAGTPPASCRGAAKEREVLFLDSRAGAGRTSSPNRSPPVNLVEMTNGGGEFGLAPGGGAERGLRSPSGRAVPTGDRWGAMLRSRG